MFNVEMTYEEAKLYQKKLYDKNTIDSNNLKEFDKLGKNSFGSTPDHVRELPEWKHAKNTFDSSFAELRNFNGWFTKRFKKEYAEDRRNRYNTR